MGFQARLRNSFAFCFSDLSLTFLLQTNSRPKFSITFNNDAITFFFVGEHYYSRLSPAEKKNQQKLSVVLASASRGCRRRGCISCILLLLLVLCDGCNSVLSSKHKLRASQLLPFFTHSCSRRSQCCKDCGACMQLRGLARKACTLTSHKGKCKRCLQDILITTEQKRCIFYQWKISCLPYCQVLIRLKPNKFPLK